MFFIIASSFTFLIFGLGSGAIFVGKPVVNLLIGCFLVGVAEEFLCRGWLFNEFLERFGETKKGVWFSIPSRPPLPRSSMRPVSVSYLARFTTKPKTSGQLLSFTRCGISASCFRMLRRSCRKLQW